MCRIACRNNLKPNINKIALQAQNLIQSVTQSFNYKITLSSNSKNVSTLYHNYIFTFHLFERKKKSAELKLKTYCLGISRHPIVEISLHNAQSAEVTANSWFGLFAHD